MLSIFKQKFVLWAAFGAIILIAGWGLSSTDFAQSQTHTFTFQDYEREILSEERLTELALSEIRSRVTIVEITEQVTQMVPMGAWLGILGSRPSRSDFFKDENAPAFIMAVKGTFQYGQPGEPEAQTLPSFTVALDAASGFMFHYTGAFRDPRFVSVQDMIKFPDPVHISAESTAEILPPSSTLVSGIGDDSGLIPLPPIAEETDSELIPLPPAAD